MRLVRLIVREAPGLDGGLVLDGLDNGITLIWGPNAAGKTTAARILWGTLWPDHGRLGGVRAEARWQDGEANLTARVFASQVTWDPELPPLPGPGSAPLYLLGLPSLLEATAADDAFAARIAVELAGGYDLDAAMASLAVPTRHRGDLHARFRKAHQRLKELERRHQTLAANEAQLPELERRRGEARRAQSLITVARQAVELAKLREKLAKIEAQLEAMPAGLDRLSGDEINQLHVLETRRDEAIREVETIEDDLAQAQEEAADLAFGTQPPSAEELALWRAGAQALEEAGRRRTSLEEKLTAARTQKRESAAGLFTQPPDGSVAFPAERMAQLRQIAGERERAHARVAAIETEVNLWELRIEDLPEVPAPHALARGIAALRSWLRAPRDQVRHTRSAWALFGFGLAAAVAGSAVAGVWWSLPGALLAAAAVGWIAATRSRSGAAARLDELQDEIAALGLAPDTWTVTAVQERLAAAEDRALAWKYNDILRHKAAEAHASLDAARADLERAERLVQETATALGFDSELPALPLLEAAHRLEGWLEAHERVSELTALITQTDETIHVQLHTLADRLTPLGITPPASAPEAPAVIAALDKRVGRYTNAVRRCNDLARQREAAQKRRAQVDEELAALWRTTGLEPGQTAELARRLDRLPEYQRLRKAKETAQRDARKLEQQIEDAHGWDELSLERANFTAAEATQRLEQLTAEAKRLEPLVEQITSITRDLDEARNGSALEEARASLAEAKEAIDARRREAIEAELTRLILETARDRVQASRAPRVLRRAQAWFDQFTHHAFALEIDTASGTLRAIDLSSEETRALDELSDGTRIHLLLAARLAAIEEAEGTRAPLPLCLDEALSTTDAGRFHQVASALAELARNGRQILYFTADRGEIELWKELVKHRGDPPPTVIELPTAGNEPDAHVPEIPLPAVPEVPRPDGTDVVAYAKLLGARTPSGFDPAVSWHLVFLLPDHLDDVHTCLVTGLHRTGQLLHALDAGLSVVPQRIAALARARARVLEAVLDGWRIGRGRPLRWEDVENSGAISGTYTAAVRKLAEDHADEPEVFLERVRALKGFRRAKAAQLERALGEAGVLDEAEPVPDDEIVTRAAAAAHADWEAAGLRPASALAWARWVLELIDRPDHG